MSSILIKNVAPIVAGGASDGALDILVIDGTISAMERDLRAGDIPGTHPIPVLDGDGCIALPGLIDAHTHIRDLDLAYKEDFCTASMAAARGGITTFFDMPNSTPPTIDSNALHVKRQVATQSLIDYGFHFGSTADDNSKDIRQCHKTARPLPASVKIYLNETTGSLCITNPDTIERIVSAAWRVSAHAEEEMVPLIISIAKKYNKPLYLCHISRASEVRIIQGYRRARLDDDPPIYAEVTPHHLFFTEQDCRRNPLLTMKPPLQKQHDVDALWDAVADGTIDTIGTDHAPHTLREKQMALSDGRPMYGVPGLETAVPSLLDAAADGRITHAQIAALYATNPARIFGVRNKGKLAVGYDGDVTLIRSHGRTIPQYNTTLSKCGWTLFADRPLRGCVEATLARGAPVYLGGALYQRNPDMHRIPVRQSTDSGVILSHAGREVTCRAN